MKIVHVITGLKTGGAEQILYTICHADKKNSHCIISLTSRGEYAAKLEKVGVEVLCLNLQYKINIFTGIFELARYIKHVKPDIVQTWMFHSDLIGGIIAKYFGVKKIFWSEHAANIKLLSFTVRIIVKICSILSYIIPNAVVCCAFSTKTILIKEGYSKDKMAVINNGCDMSYYIDKGNKINRKSISSSLNMTDVLIGVVARWDIYKDIPNLLQALKILISKNDAIKCILVGDQLNLQNIILCKLLDQYELRDNVIMLGLRNDIPDILRTIDLFVLSSVSEAFPNVLVESMACGTPCVATDVGDVKYIIGKTGWIVPPSNHEALANSISLSVVEMKNSAAWVQRKKYCRDRIINNFSLDKMVTNYMDLWNK
jgi:glycosyltransferase involved in cell wall biosynthesis